MFEKIKTLSIILDFRLFSKITDTRYVSYHLLQ